MLKNIKNMLLDDEGATLVEYGLIVALIAAICVAVIATLGTKILAAFTATNDAMSTAGH